MCIFFLKLLTVVKVKLFSNEDEAYGLIFKVLLKERNITVAHMLKQLSTYGQQAGESKLFLWAPEFDHMDLYTFIMNRKEDPGKY